LCGRFCLSHNDLSQRYICLQHAAFFDGRSVQLILHVDLSMHLALHHTRRCLCLSILRRLRSVTVAIDASNRVFVPLGSNCLTLLPMLLYNDFRRLHRAGCRLHPTVEKRNSDKATYVYCVKFKMQRTTSVLSKVLTCAYRGL